MLTYPKTSPTVPAPNQLFTRFFDPLDDALARADGQRRCPVIDDRQWLLAGVLRALEPVASGRDFLQRMFPALSSVRPESSEANRSTYFEALKSERRLRHLEQAATHLAASMGKGAADPLAGLPGLENFSVFAGDGHWHAHAVHDSAWPASANRDEPPESRKYAVGHLYGLNLRSGALIHLGACDAQTRRKEHDMRALKRLEIDTLRQGAPKGGKVLWIWDKAGIDFRQWYAWKQRAGVYFLSRAKENMKLQQEAAELPWDRGDSINAGVQRDCLCGTSTGVQVRWVQYRDPIGGAVYDFVTNLMGVPPGTIAQLYRMRWDIEKVFDDIKNKQGEKKAWASGETAKRMQAQLICLAHNLMRLCERWLATDQGIVNEAEVRRRDKRVATLASRLEKQGQSLPEPWMLARRFTQVSVKLIRWLRVYLLAPTSLPPALGALRRAYATL